MPYSDHFRLADDMISHLDSIVVSTADTFIQSRYTGFVTVAAVTVYELAVKDILIAFAHNKHKAFGAFTEASLRRLNGRIALDDLRKLVKKFGAKYDKRFGHLLDASDRQLLAQGGNVPRAAYGNILVWRNSFAHEGIIPSTATYPEATNAYHVGKEVLHCLARAMQR